MTGQTARDRAGTEPSGRGGVPVGLILTLGLLTGLSPFSIDIALAAFPAMVDDLATTPTGVQFSLTGFMLGMAAGMPVFGFLSDRVGRRVPLIVALAACIGASAVAALAPTLEILVAARGAQGFCAAAGIVIGRAIVADRTSGDTAARIYGFMAMVSGVAPIVAPIVGSWVALAAGWRGAMWTLAGLVVLAFALSVAVVPESNDAGTRQRRRERSIGRPSAARALISRRFLGATLCMAFVTMLMFGYVAAAPFVYQNVLGLSPEIFALVFSSGALGMLTVNWVTTRLIGRFTVRSILWAGLMVTNAATLLLLVLVLSGVRDLWLVVTLFVMVSCTGATLPKATALAMQEVRNIAGAGSAVLGMLQYALGSALIPFVTIGGAASPVAFAVVSMAAAAIAAAAALLSGSSRREPTALAVQAEGAPGA